MKLVDQKQETLRSREEFIRFFLEYMQNQFIYAETKATFLIAGNALLLAAAVQLLPSIFLCGEESFHFKCVPYTFTFMLYMVSILLGLASVMLAMVSVTVHRVIWFPKRNPSLIFFPYIASLDKEGFVSQVTDMAADGINKHILHNIHGMACKAVSKYKWLGWAVFAGILSVTCLSLSVFVQLIWRQF